MSFALRRLCTDPRDALRTIKANGFELSETLLSQLESAYTTGFAKATAVHLANAEQRERVMASVARVAQGTIDAGRHAVILGDFNTSYERGKKGNLPSDCTLSNFSCTKGPFPKGACSDGDGFDDTLAILENGYAEEAKWKVLSKGLPRTYYDAAFADAAIDHIAVPVTSDPKFSKAERVDQLFGSDHYPVVVEFLD